MEDVRINALDKVTGLHDVNHSFRYPCVHLQETRFVILRHKEVSLNIQRHADIILWVWTVFVETCIVRLFLCLWHDIALTV